MVQLPLRSYDTFGGGSVMIKRLLIGAGFLCATVVGANALVVNVDFYDFEGRVFIETNPVSATCSADGLAFGDSFTVVYRRHITSAVSDALAFVSEHADYRISATASPFFLDGASLPAEWDTINSRATLFTGPGNTTTSDLTFTPASHLITNATEYVEITGTLNDFEGITGCTVSIRAGLVRRPN